MSELDDPRVAVHRKAVLKALRGKWRVPSTALVLRKSHESSSLTGVDMARWTLTDDEYDDDQRAIRGALQRDVADAYEAARELRGRALRRFVAQIGIKPSEDEDVDVGRLQAVAFALGSYERITRGAETLEEIKEMYNVVSRGSPRRVCHSCMARVGATARFKLGQIVATPGASALDSELLNRCMMRHAAGDWGILDDDDRAVNDRNVERGGTLHSAYIIDEAKHARLRALPHAGDPSNTLYVITEHDRSVTTLLLADEY